MEQPGDLGAGPGQSKSLHPPGLTTCQSHNGNHFQGCTRDGTVCFGDYSEWYA